MPYRSHVHVYLHMKTWWLTWKESFIQKALNNVALIFGIVKEKISNHVRSNMYKMAWSMDIHLCSKERVVTLSTSDLIEIIFKRARSSKGKLEQQQRKSFSKIRRPLQRLEYSTTKYKRESTCNNKLNLLYNCLPNYKFFVLLLTSIVIHF